MYSRNLDKNRRERLSLLLSFGLPFVICCVAYAFVGIYPFGDGQLLAHDEWHQYYPFFVSFRDKLLDGGSLQYTWDVGMGTGYASLYAYYLASPLYVLSVLIPEAYLREYFALMTVLKISFAGLFFGVFLKTAFRKTDFSLPFFALMYALCAWAGGYAWNIIWLDAFALLPLLIAGTVSLLREGRFRMYVAALALILWCNYYIAYFCCIFVFLCFFAYCIICWKGFKNFCIRFLRIGLCTLLGAGISAVLLLTTMLAMGGTNSAAGKEFQYLRLNVVSGAYGIIKAGDLGEVLRSGSISELKNYLFGEGGLWELLKTETLPGIVQGTREILIHLLPGTEVNKFDGNYPTLFCSFTAVILAAYGLFNKKISLREKLISILLLIFFTLSFLLRFLDYFWHGFHFPNMLYFRFSFLFSFVLIAAAYRSYTQLEHGNKWFLPVAVALSSLLLVNYCFTAEELSWIVILATAAVLVAVTTALLLHGKKKRCRQIALIALCAVVSLEMILCFGMAAAKIGFSKRSAYPKAQEYVQALLDYTQQQEDELFWRTEVTETQTLNDGALNHYDGVSIFTSSANVNFNRFSRSLGLSSWPGSNRFSYYEAMPFTNTLCGIEYLIDRNGDHLNRDYNTLLASSGEVNLLKNQAYISLGFMTDSAFSEFVSLNTSTDPIADQNKMFSLATGIQSPLYTTLELDHYEAQNGGTLSPNGAGFRFSSEEGDEDASLRFAYAIPKSGLYCATSSTVSGTTEVDVFLNGELLFSRNIKARSLFTLGNLRAGDLVELVYNLEDGKSGTLSFDVAGMDREVFDAGFALLADEPWVLTEFSDTHVAGTVEAKADGLFYTSIPYEPGWRAYVDGQEVFLAESYDASSPDVKLTDAVIAFPLSAGSHTVELEYEAPGLKLGAIISGSCLLIFAALVFFLRKKPVLLPDKYSEEEYYYVPEEEFPESPSEPDVPEGAPDEMGSFDYTEILEEFSETEPCDELSQGSQGADELMLTVDEIIDSLTHEEKPEE